jgi:hypothetical protein
MPLRLPRRLAGKVAEIEKKWARRIQKRFAGPSLLRQRLAYAKILARRPKIGVAALLEIDRIVLPYAVRCFCNCVQRISHPQLAQQDLAQWSVTFASSNEVCAHGPVGLVKDH